MVGEVDTGVCGVCRKHIVGLVSKILVLEKKVTTPSLIDVYFTERTATPQTFPRMPESTRGKRGDYQNCSMPYCKGGPGK